MSLTIEVIDRNDTKTVERLVEIEKNAFGHGALSEWEIVPFIRHGLVITLKVDGVVVGGAQFLRDWREPDRAYLFGIAVDASCRGKGYGTRFLSACLEHLKISGIKSVELTVDASNTAAVRVYKDKLGFETRETRVAEYGKGEDRLVMIKALSGRQ